jgi:hypothetical protein
MIPPVDTRMPRGTTGSSDSEDGLGNWWRDRNGTRNDPNDVFRETTVCVSEIRWDCDQSIRLVNVRIMRYRRQLGSAYNGLAARVIARAHVAIASHLLAASHLSFGHAWRR